MSNNYGPKIVTEGIILAYDAADRNSYPLSGSTIYDLSGNNNGTINGATYSALNNGYFNFNGHNINTGQTYNFNKTDQFSVEFWINFLSHTDKASAAAGIVGKGHYYSNTWDIWLWNDHRIAFETAGDATRQGYTRIETAILSINTWYHYIATYNNGSKEVFLNGSSIGTQTYSGPGNFTNSNNVLIGQRFNDSYRSLRGKIPIIKIYNLALNQEQAQDNYKALKARYGL